ncbi:MAG: YslB family protein [Lysinibacillus sp.]
MPNNQSHKISSFGYEIIRDHLLSSILGKHEDDVLYWAGKELARKFPCQTHEEIISFFAEASWGTLTIEKEMKNGLTLLLTNDIHIKTRSTRLEAGFLAEQIQLAKGYLTECYDEQLKKQLGTSFTIKWDVKERIMNTITSY